MATQTLTQTPSQQHHILTCLQEIGERTYVRLVASPRTSDLATQLKLAYPAANGISICSTIDVFYYCGDLLPRVEADISYKRFRLQKKQLVSVAHGLWEVPGASGAVAKAWYTSEFQPWLEQKLRSYMEDLGEAPQEAGEQELNVPLDNVKWSTINRCGLVQQRDGMFELLQCERNSDGHYVVSHSHILTLVALYWPHARAASEQRATRFNTRLGPFQVLSSADADGADGQPKTSTETDKDISSDLTVAPCTRMRGLCLSKSELSLSDISFLLQRVGIDDDAVCRACMSSDLPADASLSKCADTDNNTMLDYLDISVRPELGGDLDFVFQVSETLQDAIRKMQAKEPQYSVLPCNLTADVDEASQLPMTVDCSFMMRQVETFNSIIRPANSYQSDAAPVSDAPQLPQRENHVLYRSLLDQSVRVIAEEVPLLAEFAKACTMTGVSSFMHGVLQLINASPITIADIGELQHLLTSLTDADASTNPTDKCSSHNHQQTLTAKYVRQFVDSSAETLATHVIDNVCSYLSEQGCNKDSINRNQVGQDLVECGVQKSRKARGYVYGIADSQHRLKAANANLNNWLNISSIAR